MDQDREQRQALIAAGYTGTKGAVLFCLLLAVVGAVFGSVVFAIIWNVALPGSSESLSTFAGAAAGAAFGGVLGLMKVRQGNLEAREQVEDRQWRRLIRRQHPGNDALR